MALVASSCGSDGPMVASLAAPALVCTLCWLGLLGGGVVGLVAARSAPVGAAAPAAAAIAPAAGAPLAVAAVPTGPKAKWLTAARIVGLSAIGVVLISAVLPWGYTPPASAAGKAEAALRNVLGADNAPAAETPEDWAETLTALRATAAILALVALGLAFVPKPALRAGFWWGLAALGLLQSVLLVWAQRLHMARWDRGGWGVKFGLFVIKKLAAAGR